MATTWAGTASNGLITRAALQDAVNTGVLILKSSITGTSTQCVTKTNVESFIYMNTADTTWSGYASNQLPPKSAISGAGVVAYTGQYSATSCAAACTSTDIRTIYVGGALNTGMYAFTDAALTTRASNGYYVIPGQGYCYFLDQFKTVNGYVTSRTAQTFYTLTLYGSMGAAGFPSNVTIQYSTASSTGPWLNAGTISSTSCSLLTNLSFCGSTTVWLQAIRTDNSTAVFFNTSTTSTCPANTAVTCLPNVVMSANATRAITIRVASNNFVAC